MKIMNGIEMLEIPANITGTSSVIYPSVIWDEKTVLLVDAGYPGYSHKIREAAQKAGIPFDRLNGIILTHQDIDHVGGVSELLKESQGNIEVWAHEKEAAYIDGSMKPVKLSQLETNLDRLPEGMKKMYEMLKTGFEKSKVEINKMLHDGEEIPCCGGIEVIYTPGHTPGHICLYLRKYEILIAGDALVVEGNELVTPMPSIDFDRVMSKESLVKLTQYDIDTVICYHGGLYRGNVNQRIRELAGK